MSVTRTAPAETSFYAEIDLSSESSSSKTAKTSMKLRLTNLFTSQRITGTACNVQVSSIAQLNLGMDACGWRTVNWVAFDSIVSTFPNLERVELQFVNTGDRQEFVDQGQVQKLDSSNYRESIVKCILVTQPIMLLYI